MPTAALDEGIVQPAAKAAELLSPRLHQLMVPGRSAGDLFFKSCGQISTNTQLLRILLQTSAGHITNKRRELAHHSPSFAYTLSSRQTLALLVQIADLLRTYKAGRANLLIEEYLLVTPRNGHYDSTRRAAMESFERRFFAISTRASNVGRHRLGSR